MKTLPPDKVECYLGVLVDQDALWRGFAADARRILGRPYESRERDADGLPIIRQPYADKSTVTALIADLNAAGYEVEIVPTGERRYRIERRLDVVAWKSHRGGRLGGSGRPSLSDFGRWSALHRSAGGTSRLDERTAYGRSIPMPHHTYRYVRSLEGMEEVNATIPFANEQIRACRRCFPEGLPSQ